MEWDVGGVWIRLLVPAVVDAIVDETEDDDDDVDGELTGFAGTVIIPFAAKACVIFCCSEALSLAMIADVDSPLDTLGMLEGLPV